MMHLNTVPSCLCFPCLKTFLTIHSYFLLTLDLSFVKTWSGKASAPRRRGGTEEPTATPRIGKAGESNLMKNDNCIKPKEGASQVAHFTSIWESKEPQESVISSFEGENSTLECVSRRSDWNAFPSSELKQIREPEGNRWFWITSTKFLVLNGLQNQLLPSYTLHKFRE